jgi:hypothetical protein
MGESVFGEVELQILTGDPVKLVLYRAERQRLVGKPEFDALEAKIQSGLISARRCGWNDGRRATAFVQATHLPIFRMRHAATRPHSAALPRCGCRT